MTINENLILEIQRRMIDEGIARLEYCVSQLSETHLAYVPNNNSNSVTNLILHLNGNVRQWLIGIFRRLPDNRERSKEFDINKLTREELLEILTKLKIDIIATLPYIASANLTTKVTVQIYEETLLSIIIHVIEHFSRHVGQVTYITKMLLDIDTGYYANENLD